MSTVFFTTAGRCLAQACVLAGRPFCAARPASVKPPGYGPDARRSNASAGASETRLRAPRRAVAVASLLAAMVLVVLDSAIANVALPAIAESLHVTPALAVRVVTAYQCALLMALLPCAALGESLGYRRVFTGGVALFAAASALCALSPSLDWLVAARFLQGLGAAGVMALGVALLRVVVADDRLGAAIGWNTLAVALSSAAGPAIGAAILSTARWPWLFAVNLPLAALVMLGARALPASGGTARRLDLASVALNAGAFASLVMGAELLPAQPALAAILFAAAALAMTALVLREMPKKAPLVPVDLLRVDSFRFSVIASVCCFTGQTAAMIALPFYLGHALGQDTLTVGFYMMPWPLAVAIAAPLAGRCANRVSTAWLCAAGGICLASGLCAAALWPLKGDPLPLVPLMVLCGLGFGFFNVGNNRNMFLSAPEGRSGAAGAMQGTARLLGQTAGALVITLLYTLAPAGLAPRLGLGVGAALTLAAAIVSMLRAAKA